MITDKNQHYFINIENKEKKNIINEITKDKNYEYILITNENKEALKEICNEIDKRYILFVENKVRNIDDYNKINNKKKYIVIIDNITKTDEANYYLNFVLNLGRSAGIYLNALGNNDSWLNGELNFPNKL